MKAENVNIVACNLQSTVLDGNRWKCFLCLNCLAMIRDIVHSFKCFRANRFERVRSS